MRSPRPQPTGRDFYISFYEVLDENNKRENGMLIKLIKLILKRKQENNFMSVVMLRRLI